MPCQRNTYLQYVTGCSLTYPEWSLVLYLGCFLNVTNYEVPIINQMFYVCIPAILVNFVLSFMGRLFVHAATSNVRYSLGLTYTLKILVIDLIKSPHGLPGLQTTLYTIRESCEGTCILRYNYLIFTHTHTNRQHTHTHTQIANHFVSAICIGVSPN